MRVQATFIQKEAEYCACSLCRHIFGFFRISLELIRLRLSSIRFQPGWNLIEEGPADLPAICGWPRSALYAAGLRRSSPCWVDASAPRGGFGSSAAARGFRIFRIFRYFQLLARCHRLVRSIEISLFINFRSDFDPVLFCKAFV